MKKYLLFITVTLLLISCSSTKPDSAGFDAAAAIAMEVEAANLMPWVVKLAMLRATDTPVDNTGFEEDDHFPSSHLTRDEAADMVYNDLAAMGYSPVVLSQGSGALVAYNVYADLPGTLHPEEVILLGAHLDAFYAGADDNGSAVAALLEAARVLKGHNFDKTIRFMAFDLEEFGSIGSTRYIEAGYADDVVKAIVMDCVGYSSSESGSQDDIMGIRMPDKGDFLVVAGNHDSRDMVQKMVALSSAYNLNKSLGIIAPGDGTAFLTSAFMRSDNGLLWYKGIPSVLLSDTANFRNPHYHEPTDTPETLNADFLYRNTRALVALSALYAGVVE